MALTHHPKRLLIFTGILHGHRCQKPSSKVSNRARHAKNGHSGYIKSAESLSSEIQRLEDR
jgi:hypothetical protein